jgi:hypothetical protein
MAFINAVVYFISRFSASGSSRRSHRSRRTRPAFSVLLLNIPPQRQTQTE